MKIELPCCHPVAGEGSMNPAAQQQCALFFNFAQNDKPIDDGRIESETRMSKFAEPMSRLIDELKKLPGVGAKSAQRLAFYILRSSDEDAEALATAVRDVKANLRLCSVCNNITDVDPCVYCTSATRNQRLVCVVEEPTNISSIEKTPSISTECSMCCTVPSRRCTGLGPSSCASRI